MKPAAETRSPRGEAKGAVVSSDHIRQRELEAFVRGMTWGPAADAIERHLLQCNECVLLAFYIDACVEADELDAFIRASS